MYDLTTERSFGSQATLCLAYFLTRLIHKCLYDQALADVRSTGAGIKCLYCTACNGHDHPIAQDNCWILTVVGYIQCRDLIPALNVCAVRAYYTTAHPIDVFEPFKKNMLTMEFCTTRHWQTSGRLVQELNVCTVVAV